MPGRAKNEFNIGNDWALVELERSLDIEPVELSSRSFKDMREAAAEACRLDPGHASARSLWDELRHERR